MGSFDTSRVWLSASNTFCFRVSIHKNPFVSFAWLYSATLLTIVTLFLKNVIKYKFLCLIAAQINCLKQIESFFEVVVVESYVQLYSCTYKSPFGQQPSQSVCLCVFFQTTSTWLYLLILSAMWHLAQSLRCTKSRGHYQILEIDYMKG